MEEEKKKINMKTVRWVEIVSRLTSDDGVVLFDIDNAMEVIQQKEKVIDDYCYVIHDRDTYEEDSETHKQGDLKPAHVHLLIKFKKNQPQKLGYIAQWFGIPENFINSRGKDWESACLYLTHTNAPDKFQYAASDVTSSFDYEEFVEEYLAEQNDGEENAPKKGKTKKEPEIDKYIKKILSGEIREYNKTLKIDHMLLVKYSQKVELAFKVRSEYLQATQKDRNMECCYITGPSGCGKTTLARKMAMARGLAYFVSSGSNDIMDGYAQEPCIIVDDIRPSVLGLSDLLKMLDPHLASSVKSRYKNKYLNCELVILTTVLKIDTFYQNVFAEHDEPITQLKRRCSTYIQMDQHVINISLWDKKKMRYSTPVTFKNNILEEYVPKLYVNPEDICFHVSEKMPFLMQDLLSLNMEEPQTSPKGQHPEPEPEEKTGTAEETIPELDFKEILHGTSQQDDNKNSNEKGEKQNGQCKNETK